MKFLRSMLDRLEPHFTEGRLKLLYPLYEAADTFLYTPGETAKSGAFIRDSLDLKRMMSMVVLALGPCILMAFYNTGLQANLAMEQGYPPFSEWRQGVIDALGVGNSPDNVIACCILGGLYFLPAYIITMTVGGLWELLFSTVRKHEINEGFLVTGMLFPLTLPPTIPLWQVAIGISFGVVLGKEVFGGTGKNFLNPALTARAFLYFASPAQISGDSVWTAVKPVDGYSAATPLGELAVATPGEGIGTFDLTSLSDWLTAFSGFMQGSMGETSALACVLGAVVLISTGIGSWRIMLSVVLGMVLMSTPFWLVGVLSPETTTPLVALGPHWHLVLGGFAFGTVFMATDPVSAAMTLSGQWAYGILIGVLTVLIRVINPAFPEGIMLAILFGNVMAPVIDYFVIQANVKRRKARYAA